jgi:hypothetical protein
MKVENGGSIMNYDEQFGSMLVKTDEELKSIFKNSICEPVPSFVCGPIDYRFYKVSDSERPKYKRTKRGLSGKQRKNLHKLYSGK